MSLQNCLMSRGKRAKRACDMPVIPHDECSYVEDDTDTVPIEWDILPPGYSWKKVWHPNWNLNPTPDPGNKKSPIKHKKKFPKNKIHPKPKIVKDPGGNKIEIFSRSQAEQVVGRIERKGFFRVDVGYYIKYQAFGISTIRFFNHKNDLDKFCMITCSRDCGFPRLKL